MAKYNWTFATIGGNTRVQIKSGKDIAHLEELDQKMWTVLSCPTKGLEIDEKSLTLIDTDGDGRVKVNEVVATSKWLCSVLKNPDTLLEGKDSLKPEEIADETIAAIAKEVAGEKGEASIADVEAAITAAAPEEVVAEEKPLPEAPYDAAIIAAYHDDKEAYDLYFTDLRLEKLGLKKTDPETAPAIKEEAWKEFTEKIGAYEAEKATIEGENAAAKAAADEANAAAKAAATAKYQDLRKLLYLTRDFYTLLRNYVSFQDFYTRDKKADFQCGTLVIDQRACHLCVRVQDAGAMAASAGLSGMYLLFCDCVSKPTGKTMSIVAAMTVGDVDDLFVGKNAIFYDRDGVDYDAKVTKIIDNPISIKQAFWSPYKKFGKWVKDLINKSATEKESKGFEDMKAKAAESASNAKEGAKEGAPTKQQAFDIAKFAGIFAAIGMALGFIGSFFVSLGQGIAALTWWQLILVIIAILLCISGPSMFLAWLKLRARNMAPILNANGWAINARALVNVPFGITLSDEAKFPIVAGKDPFAEKKMPVWKKTLIWLVLIALIVCGLWLGNLLKFAGEKYQSPLPCFNKVEVVEEAPAEEEVVVEVEVADNAEEAPATEAE